MNSLSQIVSSFLHLGFGCSAKYLPILVAALFYYSSVDGIAAAQPSFKNGAFTFSAQTLFHNKFVFGNEKRLAPGWKSFKRENKFDSGCDMMQPSVLMVRAVATLEPVCSVQSNARQGRPDNPQPGVDSRSASGIRVDSEELDEREKLRRMRISKANKGNTPWNKGRKHSAETLQRIRERTWIAMQDPKVKMKLVNAGHAQSEETRMKIAVGVRMGWERRREKLMLQETCYFEWQNLIAEASRKGFVGEEELQWDSYKILEKQLKSEWLDRVEQTKNMPRPKGNRRAPKSLEQRRKISEAISAKWADPAYRERVCSALSDYYGTPAGAGRNLRRRPSGERKSRTERPIKKKAKDTNDDTKSQNRHPRFKRSNVPLYKDPLASSKLEMIKNIRAKRAAAETKKTDAISQAKLLIAEAEKAAKALEAAAMRNPLARASLSETRELIAEAIQSIQSIENEQIDSHENDRHPSIVSSELIINNEEEENNPSINNLSQTDHREPNGIPAMESSKSGIVDFCFGEFDFQDILDDGKDEVLHARSGVYSLLNGEEVHQRGASELHGITIKQPRFAEQLSQMVLNGKNCHEKSLLLNGAEETPPPNSVTVSKKWVCGRLVEMVEGA